MFDSDQDQRTHPPSPRRRADARQSGSVPRSPDVSATLVLTLFTFGLVFIGPSLFEAGRELLTESFTRLQTDAGADELWAPTHATVRLCGLAAVWLLLAAGCAIVGNVIQFGPLFAPQVIQPDPDRLSPGRGLQRMFAEFHPRALLLHAARLVTIAAVAGWFIWSVWPGLFSPEADRIGDSLADAVLILGSCLAGGAALVSLLSAVAARLRHEAQLRMTPQEAREEQRLNEADPSVVERRRETRRNVVGRVTSDR